MLLIYYLDYLFKWWTFFSIITVSTFVVRTKPINYLALTVTSYLSTHVAIILIMLH